MGDTPNWNRPETSRRPGESRFGMNGKGRRLRRTRSLHLRSRAYSGQVRRRRTTENPASSAPSRSGEGSTRGEPHPATEDPESGFRSGRPAFRPRRRRSARRAPGSGTRFEISHRRRSSDPRGRTVGCSCGPSRLPGRRRSPGPAPRPEDPNGPFGTWYRSRSGVGLRCPRGMAMTGTPGCVSARTVSGVNPTIVARNNPRP